MTDPVTETIAAIATPQGRGGVGIVRVSGPRARAISEQLSGAVPAPRVARYSDFCLQQQTIDQGLTLFFPSPHSFTGEDVVEFHGHGGPVVLDTLLAAVCSLGARIANPGEFSQRAYLNDKIDLSQAEAIADLIDSETVASARLAVRSLQGAFSRHIERLTESVTRLRMYVEAAIDFPEEEIDFLSDGRVARDLQQIVDDLADVQNAANVGRVMRDGITLVIAGRPNAGKSSLLNALAGYDSAIVTAIPGTTRDVLRERIQIDGMPVHLIDTAGLRDSEDAVEKIGVQRARHEMKNADRVVWVYDGAADPLHADFDAADLPEGVPVVFVHNKADLSGTPVGRVDTAGDDVIAISAMTGEGIDALRTYLKGSMGLGEGNQGEFSARRRHLQALSIASQFLTAGQAALREGLSGELLAEDLRLCQQALAEITGEFTADDLLGEIFSSFCIGK